MIKIDAIAPNFEPRRKILPKIPAPPIPEPEMSELESAFLCSLLEMHKPKKILEVGVAAGGTTAIILQCLEDIGQKYEMYSVDISSKYHLDKSKDTAFMLTYAKENKCIIPSTPPPRCGAVRRS